MENKNLPAYPIPIAANEVGIYSSFDANGGKSLLGLTKREHFAVMAMQGYLSSYGGNLATPNAELVATQSVKYADALLAELEK